MGFALSHAAGASSDALQELLKRKFLEQIQTQRLNEDARQADMQNALGTRQLEATEALRRDTLTATEQFRRDQAAALKEQRDFQNAQAAENAFRDQLTDLPIGARITGEQAVPFAQYRRNQLLKPTVNAAGEPEFEYTGTGPMQTAAKTAGEADAKFYQHAGFTAGMNQRAADAAFERQKELARLQAGLQQTGSADEVVGTGEDANGNEVTTILNKRTGKVRIAEMPPGVRIRRAGATDTQVQQDEIGDTLDVVDEIRNHASLPNAVGVMDAYTGGIFTDQAGVKEFRNLHNNLTAKLQLAQAGKLKGQGPITDNERLMLARAVSALDTATSEETYLRELAKAEALLERQLKMPAAVAQALQGQGDGRHTLSDGSVWIKKGNRIRRGR